MTTSDLLPNLASCFKLRFETPQTWVDIVLNNFDAFLIDHAAAEKKASGMAISMLSHYPDKPDIVMAMIDLAIEEMAHFKEVVKIMASRNLQLAPDTKDQYMNKFRKHIRNGSQEYFLDRLIVAGIVEARGCERFGLIANALPQGKLKKFYRVITDSEAKHENLFIDLACNHFEQDIVKQRLDQLLDVEAHIVKQLPIQPALH